MLSKEREGKSLVTHLKILPFRSYANLLHRAVSQGQESKKPKGEGKKAKPLQTTETHRALPYGREKSEVGQEKRGWERKGFRLNPTTFAMQEQQKTPTLSKIEYRYRTHPSMHPSSIHPSLHHEQSRPSEKKKKKRQNTNLK